MEHREVIRIDDVPSQTRTQDSSRRRNHGQAPISNIQRRASPNVEEILRKNRGHYGASIRSESEFESEEKFEGF